ncbi:MAG: HAMP domain-containing protein [Deltaproteobacteria bacterium]|nr:HAMP domain-containing protein [Deltaproteobacteria bacterium]
MFSSFRTWSFLLRSASFGTVLMLSLFSLAYLVHFQLPEVVAEDTFSSNLGFFLLVNFNVIVVLVLGFMVVKNVFKLLLDRRRKILGSRMRARLVAAFVGLSLVPTVLLFLVAKGILETVLQGWFSPQIVSSMDSAINVARHHYEWQEEQLGRNLDFLTAEVEKLLSEVANGKGVQPLNGNKDLGERVWRYLADKQREYGLAEVLLVDANAEVIIGAPAPGGKEFKKIIPPPNAETLRAIPPKSLRFAPEQSIDGEFLRGYVAIDLPQGKLLSFSNGERARVVENKGRVSREATPSRYFLVATMSLVPELSSALAGVVKAFDDYKELSNYRRPLASSYVLTLVMVTLMIVFAAIWVGFYLARGLSGPIQLVAEGTQQVAQGNLDYQIAEVGDDELGVLVHSFNTMTEDLKRTTGELMSRKRYMETVLASVGVGVVALDRNSLVTTINIAAGEMLDCDSKKDVSGKKLAELFPNELADKVETMISELSESPEKVFTTNLSIVLRGVSHKIQITVNKLVDDAGEILGSVILLDDLTELVNAQRMAAWQEVARRIAHEIKNPLTPISLSAERLLRRSRRKDKERGEDGVQTQVVEQKVVEDCAEIIISQVATLRTLVDEFSRFARMPKVELKPVALGQLINEIVITQRQWHHRIDFVLDIDPRIPLIDLDRVQIGQVLVNLLDNAVSGVFLRLLGADEDKVVNANLDLSLDDADFKELCQKRGFSPRIGVKAYYDEDLGLVTIAIEDNGIGVSDADKPRIFEPYFSTKKRGTGLGLAIVSTIIADHDGFMRVRDNDYGGATFSIELPVVRGALRQKA